MLAAVYVARKPNVYQSNAKIQVDLEQANPDLVVVGDRPRAVSNPDPSYFNTQLQLLSSDALYDARSRSTISIRTLTLSKPRMKARHRHGARS